MSDFISTSGGKIVNVESIAFLTTRTPAAEGETEGPGTQLIVAFAATSSTARGSMMPLSLVMEGREALEFLEQLSTRGAVVDHLRSKLEGPTP